MNNIEIELTVQNPLTPDEQHELDQCEGIIKAGKQTFIAVGEALLVIRDSKLYRQNFSSFQEYTEQRWGWTRNRAYQLMDAVAVVRCIEDAGLPSPTSERQARSLAKLPVEEQVDAWRQAVDASETATPTSDQVDQVVRTRIKPKSEGSVSAHSLAVSAAVEDVERVLTRQIQNIEPAGRIEFFKAFSAKLRYHRSLCRNETSKISPEPEA